MTDHPGSAPSSPGLDPEPALPAAPHAPRAPWRLWLAVVIGTALALPLGWLMTPVALLPFELGLFFFLILGLLMGAALYRLARPAAPAPRLHLYIASAVISLTFWSTTMVTEYLTLPQVMLNPRGSLRKSTNRVLTPDQKQDLENQVRAYLDAKLKADYPPGGVLGYCRWAATSGVIDIPRFVDSGTVRFQLSQRTVLWIVRVVLSLAFTGGAVLSQLMGLAPQPPPEPQPSDPVQA